MLDASAEQLSRRFADKPAEKARVLQVLGDLYLTLHDFEGAAPVLSRFLDSADAGADPEARAHIQLDLAMVEFDRGNLESAQRLLTQAQHFWTTIRAAIAPNWSIADHSSRRSRAHTATCRRDSNPAPGTGRVGGVER